MGAVGRNSDGAKMSEYHYPFAHIALRQVAFAHPVRIFAILASEEAAGLFDDLIAHMESATPTSAPCRFRGADIEVHPCSVQGRACAIVEMPEPQEAVQAYFVAIVSRLQVEDLGAAALAGLPEGELLDYYTFERPVVITEDRQTVFCSWTADNTHSNMGDGPPPTLARVKEFLDAHVAPI
jgi:hypothetical protein